MEPTYEFEIIKIKGDKRYPFTDTLIREIKLQIYVNGKEISALMSTPVDQKELCVGYLLSENILASVDDISSIVLSEDGDNVEIVARIDEDAASRLDSEGVVISGCGRGKTANIDIDAIEAKVNTIDYHINTDLIIKEMDGFLHHCQLYQQTGSVHTAKLYLEDGRYFIAEDIAQHNTVDKVMGKAKLAKVDTTRAVLLVSGRLSSEMVAKAVMHEVPILISRTASTCLGVRIADKFGITLVGFVRGDRMNIYTNGWRIDG